MIILKWEIRMFLCYGKYEKVFKKTEMIEYNATYNAILYR